jgi:hypothetical protein
MEMLEIHTIKRRVQDFPCERIVGCDYLDNLSTIAAEFDSVLRRAAMTVRTATGEKRVSGQ